MISTESPGRIVCNCAAQITCAFGAAFGQHIHVVPITSSRDVSDPRTDPGVGVRGPAVGALTSWLLSDAVNSRGEGRRALNVGEKATIVRNANVLQEKSSGGSQR